jgi:hypothetical protein
VHYVVIEKWPNDPLRHTRLPPKTPLEKLQDQEIKQTWPVQRGKELSQVAVYEVPY